MITMMCQTVRIVFQELLKFLSNRSQNAKFAWVQNGIGKNVLDSEKFFSLTGRLGVIRPRVETAKWQI